MLDIHKEMKGKWFNFICEASLRSFIVQGFGCHYNLYMNLKNKEAKISDLLLFIHFLEFSSFLGMKIIF